MRLVLLTAGVAALLLSGLATAAVGFMRLRTPDEAAAARFADKRIQMVRMYRDYDSLDSAFAGTRRDLPTLPGHLMQTTVARVRSTDATESYTRVTVTVSGPKLAEPVTRTVHIPAPTGTTANPVPASQS